MNEKSLCTHIPLWEVERGGLCYDLGGNIDWWRTVEGSAPIELSE